MTFVIAKRILHIHVDISKSMCRNVLAGSIFFAQLDSAVVSLPGTALIVNMI